MPDFDIHADLRKASTLPGEFYRSREVFEKLKENVFAATWLYAADAAIIEKAGQAHPFTLLPGVLDEPLVLVRDHEGQKYCLSNVCTHRGKVVVEAPGTFSQLRCGYHGRCFRLDGSFKTMPSFEQAENFPSEKDHLTKVAFAEWLGLLFVSLQPKVRFEEMVRPIQERLSWLPLDTLEFMPEASQDYFVNANWALYCDNFLEGFHIPFVHPALNKALDFKAYSYEIFPYSSLQIGIADEGQMSFDIPAGAADFGKKVYAYYWFLFPNLMLNFYPWGLSFNTVEPLSYDRCKISFRTYRFRGIPFTREDNNLHQTEMEDEAVVESVQRGIQSRFYDRGRFSPTMEQGVHHFHRLVAAFLDEK